MFIVHCKDAVELLREYRAKIGSEFKASTTKSSQSFWEAVCVTVKAQMIKLKLDKTGTGRVREA